MTLAALRAQLASLVAPLDADDRRLSTGIAALDALLPGRGLPRGRLTELSGPRGGGKTTLLRELVAASVKSGRWVGYVDAGRTLAPVDWVGLDALWVIRPKEARRGAWCADILLRSGAFALVVLDGAPPLSRGAAVRLTRLAQSAGATLVVTSDDERSATLGSALRLRVVRAPARAGRGGSGGGRRRSDDGELAGQGVGTTQVAITVEKGGTRRTVEVVYGARVARRLCTHSEVPDRRGVARERRASDVRCAAESEPAIASGRVVARKRRCAEPDYPARAAAGERSARVRGALG